MTLWYRYVFLPWRYRLREKLLMKLAWLLPRSVLYWAVIRAGSVYRTSPDSITVERILKDLQEYA